MNIAIFASAFHPHLGGVEELCRQLAMEYRRRGHGVIVLTNRWPRSLAVEEVVEGIPVHRLAMRVAGSCAKSKLSYLLTGGAIRRQMLGILKKFKPDVLHVQCVSSTAHYALAAKRALGLPLVVTLQGELTMDASQVFQREAWAQRVMRRSLAEADAITACSRHTQQEAERWFGTPFGERGRVIFNGIDVDEARRATPFEHPRPYVLAIGRHVKQKGFDLVIRAMGKLKAEAAFDHDLILAGDGPERAALEQLATVEGVADRVRFVGGVDHATAIRLFAGCSFFVLPSRHEPFGIVNLEAMAAGKAVVAAAVGGVPEIVVNVDNGLLMEPGNMAALASAMALLATDAELRDRLGGNGRARAERFSWANIADEYSMVFERVQDASLSTAARRTHSTTLVGVHARPTSVDVPTILS